MTVPGTMTLRRLAAPLLEQLDRPGVTEVCVNRPFTIWIEREGQWESVGAASLDFDTLWAIAILAAAQTGQSIGPTQPICSTHLPGGERAQVVVPPAVAPGMVALAVRKPPSFTPNLDRLAEGGLFLPTRTAPAGTSAVDAELLRLLGGERFTDFLRMAVHTRKNIGICGPVGSGKTTLMKALAAEIPAEERLISIEDTSELHLTNPNSVSLFYSKGGQGSAAAVTSTALLEASLRMYPSRVLMGELRDEAAFTYIRGGAAGHPGSIATWHAKSAREARDALRLMFKEHPSGRAMTDDTIDGLLRQFVDVVVFCERAGGDFAVREILFEPEAAA